MRAVGPALPLSLLHVGQPGEGHRLPPGSRPVRGSVGAGPAGLSMPLCQPVSRRGSQQGGRMAPLPPALRHPAAAPAAGSGLAALQGRAWPLLGVLAGKVQSSTSFHKATLFSANPPRIGVHFFQVIQQHVNGKGLSPRLREP